MSFVQRPDRPRAPPSWLASRTTNWLAGMESSPSPGRRLLPFLLLYVAVLTAFATFTFGWGTLHHDMTEAWAWGRDEDALVDRSTSPWDREWRRPSHADKRRAWRRHLLGEEILAVLRPGATEAEIQAAADWLLSLAA